MVRSDPLRIKAKNDKKASQSTPFSVKLHLVLVMINPCAMPAPVKTAIWGRTARPFPVPCNAASQKNAMQFLFLQGSCSKNTATQFLKLQRGFQNCIAFFQKKNKNCKCSVDNCKRRFQKLHHIVRRKSVKNTFYFEVCVKKLQVHLKNKKNL